jgi:3-oxoacyl-[acyl-carrier-protein] synthase III
LKSNGIIVSGTGSYLPSSEITNSRISELCGLDPETIVKKTGIKSRRVAEFESASDMGAAAVKRALHNAGITTSEVGFIICCTFTPDYKYPALACKIAQVVGIEGCGVFDLMANCTGFQMGLSVGSAILSSDPLLNNVIVVAVAKQSPFIDWSDPDTAAYFGDGASAAILSRSTGVEFGFIHHKAVVVPSVYDAVRVRDGGSLYPLGEHNFGARTNFVEMNGLEVWKQVVINAPKVLAETLHEAGGDLGDVDFFLFHQANLRLIEYLMAKLKLPMDRTYTTVEKYGNTADGSIGITLDEAVSQGKIKPGEVVAFVGVGAGFIFGCSLIRWGSSD